MTVLEASSGRDLGLALARRVQAVARLFFPHGGARNAEPFGGFGLVAARQMKGLSTKLALDDRGHEGVSIFHLVAHHLRQEFRDISR